MARIGRCGTVHAGSADLGLAVRAGAGAERYSTGSKLFLDPGAKQFGGPPPNCKPPQLLMGPTQLETGQLTSAHDIARLSL